MIPFALFFWLVAAGSRVEVVDEWYDVPAADWRYVEFSLKQVPVTVLCDYETSGPATKARVGLLQRADLERLRQEQPHGVLALTAPGSRGRIEHHLRAAGDYVVVVDNRYSVRHPARVHLRIWLDFEGGAGPGITYVPRGRRLAVIFISFAVFFGIVTWSARRLLGAIRH